MGDRVLLLYDDVEFSTLTDFLNVRATDVVVLPKSDTVGFSTFLTSNFSKSKPLGSDHYLDFARAQLVTQNVSEEIER